LEYREDMNSRRRKKTKKRENDESKEGSKRNKKFGIRRKKQQNLKKRPRNWFYKDSTNSSIHLKRKQVRGCKQRKCGIMQ